MTWLLVTRYPLVALIRRFWASFPSIHIAQFPFQVIGNCGLIFLMRCSNRPKGKDFNECGRCAGTGIKRGRTFRREADAFGERQPELPVGPAQNMTVSWHGPLASASSAVWG